MAFVSMGRARSSSASSSLPLARAGGSFPPPIPALALFFPSGRSDGRLAVAVLVDILVLGAVAEETVEEKKGDKEEEAVEGGDEAEVAGKGGEEEE